MKVAKSGVSYSGLFNRMKMALVTALGMLLWISCLLAAPAAIADEYYTGRVVGVDSLEEGIFRARFDEPLPSDCSDGKVAFWSSRLGGEEAVERAYTLILTTMHSDLAVELFITGGSGQMPRTQGSRDCVATELEIRKE